MNSVRDTLGRLFHRVEFLYMVLGFAYLGIYAVQVLVEPPADIYASLDLVSEVIFWVFAVDVVLRLIHAGGDLLTWKGAGSFLKENWLALLALLLPAFRSLRVLRVIVVIRGLEPYLKTRSSRTVIRFSPLLIKSNV